MPTPPSASGSQWPGQLTTVAPPALAASNDIAVHTPAEVAVATASARTRGSHGPTPINPHPTSAGSARYPGRTALRAAGAWSAAQRAQLVRVYRAVPLCHLDNQREQQRG